MNSILKRFVQFLSSSVLICFIFLFPCKITNSQNLLWGNNLCTNDIYAIKQEGNSFWIATRGGGLMKADSSFSQVHYYNKHNSAIPSVFLSALAIDSIGNKWIGTVDGKTGLVRFDGNNNWSVYNTSNSPIPSNDVNCVAINNGIVWVGFNNGLASFDGVNWTVFTSVIYAGNPYGVVNVQDIAFDSLGYTWICCFNQGLMKYDGTQWTVYKSSISTFIDNAVTSLTFDINGNLWIGSDGGVSHLNNNVWTTYCCNIPGLPNNNNGLYSISSIRSDTSGNVWVTNNGKGLYRFNGTTWQYFGLSIWPSYYVLANTDYLNRFCNIFIDNSGNVWVGGYYGMAKYNISWSDYTPFIQSDLTSQGISCLNYVSSSQTLSMGEVSIFNLPYYLYFPDKIKKQFKGSGLTNLHANSWSQYDVIDSCFKYSVVNSLFGKDDNLWMGIRDGVCHYYGNTFTHYDLSTIPCPYMELTTALGSNTDNLFAGTNQGHLFKFNDTSWINIPTPLADLASPIDCIIGLGDSLLIGSHSGLLKYHSMVSSFYTTSNSGIASDTINDILWDGYQYCYWIATPRGLVKTNLNYWVIYDSSNTSLPENWITTLALDNLHNLWLGTKSNGIAMFGSSIHLYNTFNSGLTDDRITDIVIDESNKIWIGTIAGGLCSFSYGTWLSINDNQKPLPFQSAMPDLRIFPNPINTTSTFNITLNKPGEASLNIYNSLGIKIKTLLSEKYIGEHFSVQWNTSDDNGNQLPPGVYFCILNASNKQVSKRIVLLQ